MVIKRFSIFVERMMAKPPALQYCLLFLFLLGSSMQVLQAQVPTKKRDPVVFDETGQPGQPINTMPGASMNGGAPRKDSLQFERRDDAKDSIRIQFRYLDSSRWQTPDLAWADFDSYFPVPSSHLYLGNNGAATQSLIFQPRAGIGFDPGFHAYDIYRFTLENTRLYRTSRPYSMLGYQLASGKEQMMMASHTQNPKPNWNIGFDYRLISAPGLFITQNNNHTNFRLFSLYQGKRKRYQQTIVLLGNNIRASENGGIQDSANLLDPNRRDRFTVPVNLGNSASFRNNPFITTILTGNTYRNTLFLFNQHYDFGKRDSIAVNDSVTDYLFYPRVRIQHRFQAEKRSFAFSDVYADSIVYKDWYEADLARRTDTFSRKESWQIIQNDLTLYQFPDTKNLAQFFAAGITWQHIRGENKTGDVRFDNLWAHGEYRNRTRNRLWEFLLRGDLYLTGPYAGDYAAQASMSRYFNKRWGYVQLLFQQSNRTPSNLFDTASFFHFSHLGPLQKENITSVGIESVSDWGRIRFQNHLLINHTYFTSRSTSVQAANPVNLIQASFSRRFRIYKRWAWYTEATVQQTDGASPVRVPLLFTRNRFVYEGRFFKNLLLSTGLEARYYTPYRANGYSPVNGQFYVQDDVTIRNRPDLAAFMHFNIRSFTGYLRAENLNTASFANGVGFVNNNFAAPAYPTQGLMIRFGVRWGFVN
ncbi:MAG: putative porin [Ferruginibacter sp.]